MMTAKRLVMSYRARFVEATRPGTRDANVRAACEIRVLGTESELIEAYRLRHDVYGALGYLRCTNSSQLEIDEFDISSIPFGAFDPVSGTMIGTLRLVTVARQPHHEHMIRRIAGALIDPAPGFHALKPRRSRLPSIVSDEIARGIAIFNAGRFPVHELSRTIVRPDHRGTGVSRGLIEVGLAYAARSGPAVLIGSCLPAHVAMYAKYGYAPLPATEVAYFESVGRVATPVICRTDRLPPPTGDHVDRLRRALATGNPGDAWEVAGASRAPVRVMSSRTMEW